MTGNGDYVMEWSQSCAVMVMTYIYIYTVHVYCDTRVVHKDFMCSRELTKQGFIQRGPPPQEEILQKPD